MDKFKNSFQKLGSFFLSLLVVVAIGFIIFNIYRSILENYKINEQIAGLKSEIEEIKKNNQYLENLIIYYNTNTFKELELRRKLGLKKPDEKMIVVLENKDQKEENNLNLPENQSQESNKGEEANYLKWWRYLTGK